jgi:hypothetical protein
VLSKSKTASSIENARKSGCEGKFDDRLAVAQTLDWAKLDHGMAKIVKAHPGMEAMMRQPHAPGSRTARSTRL